MSTEHEFIVSAHDLDAAGKHMRFPIRASWMRGALEATNIAAAGPDGELDVRFSKSGTDVVVRGTLKAELSVPCARCLEPAHVVISAPISALVVPAAVLGPHASRDEEDELAAGDADMITYDGETVVLDDVVRDELLIGIPMIPLCSESCAGISPITSQGAAAAPDIDPRLGPLLRIKQNLTE